MHVHQIVVSEEPDIDKLEIKRITKRLKSIITSIIRNLVKHCFSS